MVRAAAPRALDERRLAAASCAALSQPCPAMPDRCADGSVNAQAQTRSFSPPLWHRQCSAKCKSRRVALVHPIHSAHRCAPAAARGRGPGGVRARHGSGDAAARICGLQGAQVRPSAPCWMLWARHRPLGCPLLSMIGHSRVWPHPTPRCRLEDEPEAEANSDEENEEQPLPKARLPPPPAAATARAPLRSSPLPPAAAGPQGHPQQAARAQAQRSGSSNRGAGGVAAGCAPAAPPGSAAAAGAVGAMARPAAASPALSHPPRPADIVKKHGAAISVAAKDWVDRYKDGRAAATAELLTLLLHVRGCAQQGAANGGLRQP